MKKSFEPIKYKKIYEPLLLAFLEECLPESGRFLDINGRHSFYMDIDNSFKDFWCMFASKSHSLCQRIWLLEYVFGFF